VGELISSFSENEETIPLQNIIPLVEALESCHLIEMLDEMTKIQLNNICHKTLQQKPDVMLSVNELWELLHKLPILGDSESLASGSNPHLRKDNGDTMLHRSPYLSFEHPRSTSVVSKVTSSATKAASSTRPEARSSVIRARKKFGGEEASPSATSGYGNDWAASGMDGTSDEDEDELLDVSAQRRYSERRSCSKINEGQDHSELERSEESWSSLETSLSDNGSIRDSPPPTQPFPQLDVDLEDFKVYGGRIEGELNEVISFPGSTF
jgi:hypothetical protein